MKKIIIELKPDPFDIYLKGLIILGLILLIGLPIYFYSDLPEQIPTHFNLSGIPDDFGNKKMIWILPIIGIILSGFITVISRKPHKLNYLQKITEENAEQRYRNAVRLLSILQVLMIFSFAFIVYSTVNIALERQNDLGSLVLSFFIGSTGAVISFYIGKSK